MMSTVACASVPKITVVIGGCHGADSYAMVRDVYRVHKYFCSDVMIPSLDFLLLVLLFTQKCVIVIRNNEY